MHRKLPPFLAVIHLDIPVHLAPIFDEGFTMSEPWLDDVTWNADGLVPAIAQDAVSGRILMMAWMNKESLLATVESGYAVYWSRSRGKLWRKGESSGHQQLVKALLLDCDGDTVIIKVEQVGGIACHTGRESCFFKRFDDGQWTVQDPVLKSPDEIY